GGPTVRAVAARQPRNLRGRTLARALRCYLASLLDMPIRSATVIADERRARRLTPTVAVTVTIRGLNLVADLRDLSAFGFAIVASKPFGQGMTHQFIFAVASGPEVTLVAKAVHCQSRLI